MKYHTRLKIAFVIILVFPIILLVMSYGMFGKSQLETIEKNYGICLLYTSPSPRDRG